MHVKSNSNAADGTSRGLSPSSLEKWSRFSMALWVKLDSSWKKGCSRTSLEWYRSKEQNFCIYNEYCR